VTFITGESPMAKPRIGVLGSGEVGRSPSAGFAALGHEVKVGDVAEFGEILVLATLWSGTERP
jgi:hypothetical protein